ncbi:MAG: hypothetical protein D4R88_01310 [Methanosarcinales archaeon]|nr:MAG: hypothetical protein D4R88_01310 [Methanosarcinales archaeon]
MPPHRLTRALWLTAFAQMLRTSHTPIFLRKNHISFLADIRVIALTRILIDMLMYMSLMVFFAGFRHLMRIGNEVQLKLFLNYKV